MALHLILYLNSSKWKIVAQKLNDYVNGTKILRARRHYINFIALKVNNLNMYGNLICCKSICQIIIYYTEEIKLWPSGWLSVFSPKVLSLFCNIAKFSEGTFSGHVINFSSWPFYNLIIEPEQSYCLHNEVSQ